MKVDADALWGLAVAEGAQEVDGWAVWDVVKENRPAREGKTRPRRKSA